MPVEDGAEYIEQAGINVAEDVEVFSARHGRCTSMPGRAGSY